MTPADLKGRRVAVLGNVGPNSPSYSTENEWVRAYEHHGVEVSTFCERWPEEWARLRKVIKSSDRPDWVHWVSTPPWRLALDRDMIADVLDIAKDRTPVIATHLDRFWDIPTREQWIKTGDPYFYIDLFCTADGGSQDRWDAVGVNHRWMLPGVGERYCHRGEVREEYEADIAFVGSWRNYHHESRHRREMLANVRRFYPQTQLWPRKKTDAVRGDDLTDLYWSTKVVVGDSYFPSRDSRKLPPPNYSSDRITETLGRGGMLIHTEVEGITNGPFNLPNLETYPAWSFSKMRQRIEESLALSPAVRTRKRNAGIKHIKEHHTYEVRAVELLEMMDEEGLL